MDTKDEKGSGRNKVPIFGPLCIFLKTKNMAKIKRHLFCQGPTKQFFHFFWEKSEGFILLFIFIISTKLKEIRDFGSILPNGIVERRETRS